MLQHIHVPHFHDTPRGCTATLRSKGGILTDRRLASSHVQNSLLSSKWLPLVLRAARTALFPDNALAPARIPPTSSEVIRIKRDCAIAIVDAIPEAVRGRFFATNDTEAMADDIEESLDLLGDSYINKHLIICAVDLIAVRLFPELADEEPRDAD